MDNWEEFEAIAKELGWEQLARTLFAWVEDDEQEDFIADVYAMLVTEE